MHDSSSASVLNGRGMTRIADYLIEQLTAHGVDTVFGVPGDFVLKLFEQLEASPLTVVNTVDEQGAGFAADAYARLRGLGVVVVTWGVGGLKIVNTTAQAFAEESPVIVVSGAPSLAEVEAQLPLHHMSNGFEAQRRVFEQITVAQAVLDDPDTACAEIDRVIRAALLHKRPVYLEIPRDLTLAQSPRPVEKPSIRPTSDPDVLRAAVNDALDLWHRAHAPVGFIGLQVARYQMLGEAMSLFERSRTPISVMPLDKSAVPEDSPLFMGIYAGQMSHEPVRQYVESSDCVLMLGALLSDTNMGGGTMNALPRESLIQAGRDAVRIGYRTYEHVRLEDFIRALGERDLPVFDAISRPAAPRFPSTFEADADAPITIKRLYERLATFVTTGHTLLADPGDAMFGSLELPVRQVQTYLANAFYASLGFAVPASIGAQMAAPEQRPLVIVGDGSFQMTGQELATSLRYGLSPIVIILNNDGYLTERLMIDGAFNDVLHWDYTKLTDLFGAGRSFAVHTEGDFEAALADADAHRGEVCILDVHLEKLDASPALRRLTEKFGAAAGKTPVEA